MKRIAKQIKLAKTIALFSHSSPDPDTIGSTLALMVALKTLGKSVDVFCARDMPESFNFIEEYAEYNKNVQTYDLLLSIDTARTSMLGDFTEMFLNHNNTARLDHHTGGDDYAKINVVQKHSACAIMVMDLIQMLKIKITPKIATLLFFGLAGDTGIFKNSGTDAESFLYASKLMTLGADKNFIMREFFDKRTVEMLKLTSSVILDAEVDKKLGFALMTASFEDYENHNASKDESVSNLPNLYLGCGLKVAVILKQKDNGIGCSFRSVPEIDISKLAERLGGGGHKNASGCLLDTTLAKAKSMIKKELKQFLKEEENKC